MRWFRELCGRALSSADSVVLLCFFVYEFRGSCVSARKALCRMLVPGFWLLWTRTRVFIVLRGRSLFVILTWPPVAARKAIEFHLQYCTKSQGKGRTLFILLIIILSYFLPLILFLHLQVLCLNIYVYFFFWSSAGSTCLVFRFWFLFHFLVFCWLGLSSLGFGSVLFTTGLLLLLLVPFFAFLLAWFVLFSVSFFFY